MHELSPLGKLERKYQDELVIIGVQSPKYPAEAQPDNVRHAVERYGIAHPVVDDADARIWDAFAVSAWPTLVFVSPRGEVLGHHAGEAPFDALDHVVAELVARFDRSGDLSRRPLQLDVATFSRPLAELSFPGKVLATDTHLYIADSDHHRIVISNREGEVEQIAGSGSAGLEDGPLAAARFFRPQGMALTADAATLFVADSENHVIRAIDLRQREVRTVAGTGEQARRVQRGGPALQTSLSSPWDVALTADTLFIAMAGLHQIWALDLRRHELAVWAGTGHEGIRDGSRQAAWLAQPMGVAAQGNQLYVSCAETQAIRRVDMHTGQVETLVGAGLFDFGDEDGPAGQARLQHNQGVAIDGDTVYVADTYNNKIKVLDLNSAEVNTWLGSGRTGLLDGPGLGARFDEPGGISLAGQTLFVADTNNHTIRTADLLDGHVRTLTLRGLPG